jgi:uncharacterized membrane protein
LAKDKGLDTLIPSWSIHDIIGMWHYVQNGQACGPVETSALQALLQNGSLGPDNLVWKQGMQDWIPARSVADFGISGAQGAAPPPIPPLSLPPKVPAAAMGPDAIDIQHNKVFAVLAYIGILFLVPLLAAPRSRFARYHTNQGIVLFLAILVVSVAIPIVSIIMTPIGISAGFILPAGVLAFMIIGIIHAASGEYKPLPWIGHFRLLNET